MENKKRITEIYNNLDRTYFMDDYKNQAHEDRPFPIGHHQTISQPSLVLKMTILLDVEAHSKVLEIGTGSGYQTAILAQAAHQVYTVERIPELLTKAKQRLKQARYTNIEFKHADGSQGWSTHAPYDQIMVTAAAHTIPQKLLDQLSPHGRMVIPVGAGSVQDLLLLTKNAQGEINTQKVEKVRFVRLIED